MNHVLFSIIIPVRKQTGYLKETIKYIKKQSFKEFEVLVIDDQLSSKHSDNSLHYTGPAFKRNLGAKLAKGKYLAFLDDDSYPDLNWLNNTKKLFETDKDIVAVCGPCLTPENDSNPQKASGLVLSSILGSGGAGSYRNSFKNQRFVDDYPTVNLIVNKNAFFKAGGFDCKYWPGEDTVLCLNLTKYLNKKILYHPSVKVHHHRRPVILPHLQQLGRYAVQRGYFVKKFPQTSLRVGYFTPSVFLLYIMTLPFLLSVQTFFVLPLLLYLLLLFFTLFNFIIKGNNLPTSLLAAFTIPVTHIFYGALFILGLFKKENKFSPHQINIKTGEYVGG